MCPYGPKHFAALLPHNTKPPRYLALQSLTVYHPNAPQRSMLSKRPVDASSATPMPATDCYSKTVHGSSTHFQFLCCMRTPRKRESVNHKPQQPGKHLMAANAAFSITA